MSEIIEHPLLRTLANGLTLSRPVGAAALALDIIHKAPDFRSTQMAAKGALVLATDKADGFFARRSGIKSEYWARKDEQLDKLSYYLIMMGLALATNDERYVTYMLINYERNNITQHYRSKLAAQHLSGAARPLGQAKTVVQDVALITDLSVLGDTYPKFTHDLHIAASGLTVVSGLDIVRNARSQLQGLQAAVRAA